jgi:hypothetical protein
MRPGWLTVSARVALIAAAITGCSPADSAKRPPVTPAATALGKPQSCLFLPQLREMRIRDDWTIDFISDSGRVWRNSLSDRCPGLRMNNAITYETSLNQLCNTDIVYEVETFGTGLHRGAACGLGQFVPVKLEE